MIVKQYRLLVVDDEPHMIWLLRESFLEDFDVLGANNEKEALEIASLQQIHMVILDLKLGNESGVEVLKKIKQIAPALPVLIITAYASVPTAVEAMKCGAFDYVTKPFDIDEMRLLIRRALNISGGPESFPEELASGLSKNRIIAESEQMVMIWKLVQKVSSTEANVLISGESGTGKELVARAIHAESPRRKNPFIAVNCAALPENLLESELFGYEEGAFTGARGRKPGKFELAHGGTLLLDEIGDMQLSTQVKILRVLEEKVVDRLGSIKPTAVDVRIIASTNKELSYLVRKGEFREDLFFRLAVFPINIPPLRDRIGDVPVLAEHFLRIYSEKYHKEGLKGFHPAVLKTFSCYSWPGNVRELRNLVEQLVILSDGTFVKLEDIPPSFGVLSSLVASSENRKTSVSGSSNIKESRNKAESQAITEALRLCDGNRTKAAHLLGISRRTLQLKMNQFKIK